MKEAIEQLISCVCDEADYKSRMLVKSLPSITPFTEATVSELTDALDGDSSLALYLKLASLLSARRVTDSFCMKKRYTEDELKEYMINLVRCCSEERIYLFSMDSEDRIISSDVISDGSISFAQVIPRRIVEVALSKNAKKVIIMHNHPGGSCEPSKADISSTAGLDMLLLHSGVKLVCHYIVADGKVGRIDGGF